MKLLDAPNHSAEIDMWLDCGALGRISLSHVSSTFVVAAEAANIPACDARIILTVDGQQFVRPIKLVQGLSQSCRESMILSRDGVSPF